MHYLRTSAFLFLLIGSYFSVASASELTLRFRSGHSVSDIKAKYYKNDIFILRHSDKTEDLISVDSLVHAQFDKGSYVVPGVILGVISGGVVGGLIGNSLTREGGGGHPNLGPAITAACGIILGGVVGGIIRRKY